MSWLCGDCGMKLRDAEMRCPVCDYEEIDRLRTALEQIAPMQQNALRMIERNGFVFEDIGNEPGNWQHLAFTLYTELCEVDSIVGAALEASRTEQSV
jgi:hypothetical protein